MTATGSEARTILGVDPGSIATGWAVLCGRSSAPQLIAAGVLRAPAKQPFADRLAGLQLAFGKIVAEFSPTLSAVEAPFHGVSARSALQLAHARGVILAELSRAGVPIAEYSPAEVKKMVTGSGRADKEQVAFMVARLVGTESKSHDLTDAVAVALCHQTISETAVTR